jgi:hypothetical protein
MQFGQLKRREFMSVLGAATAWPLVARPQGTQKARRLGTLTVSPSELASHFIKAFEESMKAVAYSITSSAMASSPGRGLS